MTVRDIAYIDTFGFKTKDYVSKIEEALMHELSRYTWSRFYGPLVYAVQGGKRIRPLLLMLSTEAVGGRVNDALDAAVAVELLHTESIIHDDIIDQEISRRDQMAFHIKYGYGASLLTADFVFGMILNIASRHNDSRITSELSSAALRMCEGEFEELKIDPKLCKLTWNDYINLIQGKTASLFEIATKIGGILGGGSEKTIRSLGVYGLYLGTSYQIMDDLLDWGSEGKIADIVVPNSKSKNILEYMKHMSRSYASKARCALAALRDTEAKNQLLDLTKFLSRNQ